MEMERYVELCNMTRCQSRSLAAPGLVESQFENVVRQTAPACSRSVRGVDKTFAATWSRQLGQLKSVRWYPDRLLISTIPSITCNKSFFYKILFGIVGKLIVAGFRIADFGFRIFRERCFVKNPHSAIRNPHWFDLFFVVAGGHYAPFAFSSTNSTIALSGRPDVLDANASMNYVEFAYHIP